VQPQAATACVLTGGGQKAAFPLCYGIQLSLCKLHLGNFLHSRGVLEEEVEGVQALRSGSETAEWLMRAQTGAALEMGMS